MILKHMMMIDTMTLKSARQGPTSASTGSGIAGCDLAPCRECQNKHTQAWQELMRRTWSPSFVPDG